MLLQMIYILVWIGAGLFATMLLVNASCMILSPGLWFALPKWLASRGALKKEDHIGFMRELPIRFLGAIVIMTMGWIAVHLLASAGSR